MDIIILNKSDTPDHKKSAPNTILIDTKGDDAKKFLEEMQKPKEEKKDDKTPAIPVIDNGDIKKLLNDATSSEKDAAKTTGTKEDILNGDVIDLKVDKNKQPEKPLSPILQNDNSQFQSILKDSNGAASMKLTPEQQKETLQKGDVIDLKVDENKKPEKIISPADVKDNSEFKDILKQADKDAKAKIDPKQLKEDKVKGDIIDLQMNKEEKPVKVMVPKRQDNNEFQKILDEAKKLEETKPLKNVEAIKEEAAPKVEKEDDSDVIDLSVDKKKETAPVKPPKDNRNQEFLDILNETEKARQAQ
jgi:hypothetical protein